MEELKPLLPCPFCGKDAELDKSSDYWTVNCKTEDCFGVRYFDGEYGNTEPSFKSKEKCIERWNTRAKE